MAQDKTAQVFYHYSPAEKLRYIAQGGCYGGNAAEGAESGTGLLPLKRFVALGVAGGSGLPEKAYEGAVFGLLDPLHKGWATHEWGESGQPVFETVLHDMHDAELALLEVRVDPAVDDLYVADYGVHLDPSYKGSSFAKDAGTIKAKHAYFNSLVKWADYHAEGAADRLAYQLPEVICFSRIPKERLRLIDKRPKADIINDFRIAGGYAPYPPKPERKIDPKAQERLLKALFKL